MPAILVELAFIDCPSQNPDVEILKNKRQEMALALAEGICKYFGTAQPGAKQTEEPPLYRVQMGAFKIRKNADALQQRLRTLGHDTFIKSNGTLYRVQLGAFRIHANAESLAATLKGQGFDTFITNA